MASARELRSRTVHGSTSNSNLQRKVVQRPPRTRSNTEIFLVGFPSSSISGSQLPTKRQAFKYFLYLQCLPENAGKPAVQQLAYETIDAILPFWQMARIKVVTRQHAMQQFLKLHDRHRILMKSKGRTTDPGGKRHAFVIELDDLFDIGAPDAIQEIESNRLLSRERKDEDIRFYKDQQTERKGHMSETLGMTKYLKPVLPGSLTEFKDTS